MAVFVCDECAREQNEIMSSIKFEDSLNREIKVEMNTCFEIHVQEVT